MKQILTFLLLCIGICTNAQEYPSIFHEGRTWVFLHLGGDGYSYSTVEVSGDTIIGGIECKKLHYYDEDGQEYDTGGGYETGGKVYVSTGINLAGSDSKFRLVMDFSLQKGDEFYGYKGEKCTVYSDDTIEVCGIKRRRLTIRSGLGGYWVEGIGCSCGYSEMNPPLLNDGSLNYYIYECYDNGELVFKMSDFDSPIVTGIETVDAGTNADGAIYDVEGRRVKAPEKGKIYIRNGKKFVK